MKKIGLTLLIDDQEFDQVQYLRVLENSGLVENTKVFTYADDALEFMSANPDTEIDAIFLDINMPRMDGFEFLETASETFGDDFAKVVVVMLTTSLSPRDRERARQFKVVREFLNKPLEVTHVERVAALVADHLR